MFGRKKEEAEEKELPYHPAFDEFMKLNPPCLVAAQAKNYFSTAEIKTMVNEIAFDENLSETFLLGLLLGHDYQMVNLGPGINRWML